MEMPLIKSLQKEKYYGNGFWEYLPATTRTLIIGPSILNNNTVYHERQDRISDEYKTPFNSNAKINIKNDGQILRKEEDASPQPANNRPLNEDPTL